jgi:hypothetical protein
MTRSRNRRHDLIEGALVAFQNAWLEGKRLDPDRFCLEHPECGGELRARINNFLFVQESLSQFGRSCRNSTQRKGD